jgi:hypothetical protein
MGAYRRGDKDHVSVSLPRFLERVVDATAPLLGGLDRDAVKAKLETSSVTLLAGELTEREPGHAGFLFAANLVARLYPRICLIGSPDLVREATAEIVLINPRADVTLSTDEKSKATLGYEVSVDNGAAVSVAARGWNVYVDQPIECDLDDDQAVVPAALLAAVLGVGELFRIVFADELGHRGRSQPAPAAFNVVTLGAPRGALPTATDIPTGEFRLIGAGAIGQAAAHTLALAGARGTLVAIDPEKITLSNLQRYVLTRDTDVGSVKVELLRERLAKSSIDVIPAPTRWHAGLVNAQRPTLVALDSADARVGVQASLPGSIYNAWTQPADVGWSRHEDFGEEPCLACLYWPDRPVPSRHEQIAAAFGQHPLRILAYLVHRNIPIGLPLPAGGIPPIPGLEVPPDAAEHWLATPLVDDIAAAAGIQAGALAAWRDRPLADVYQEGICGGALLHLNVGEAPREVLVPLAHQSALAGVMLATELLIARVPELRAARRATVEGRFDVLAGPSQVMSRPRSRTTDCLCADDVFLEAYRAWVQEPGQRRERARVESEQMRWP